MISIKPHIILEGPDGAGKTTLAEQLKGKGYWYHHEKQPTETNMLVKYASTFLNTTRHREMPVVFDRLHVGELVYGPIMRGNDRMFGIQGLELLELLLKAKGALTVMCLPPYEACKGNWQDRQGQEYVEKEHLFKAVYDCYKELAERYGLIYDYTSEASIENTWKRLQMPRAYLGDDFIGDPYATVVMVGDQPNQELDLPFFAVDNSSGFLHSCLKLGGYSLKELLFMNVRNPQGQRRDVMKMLNDLPPKPHVFVTLGKHAEHALASLKSLPYDFLVVAVEHPQFVKRFNSSRSLDYARNLAAVKEMVPNNRHLRLYLQ